MTVLDLTAGESAEIVKVGASGGAAERLFSLGFTRGRYVTVLGWSILKSSVLLQCGSVRLAARRTIAQKIEVRK